MFPLFKYIWCDIKDHIVIPVRTFIRKMSLEAAYKKKINTV